MLSRCLRSGAALMKRPLGRYGIVYGMMMMERLETDHRRERHALFSRQWSERRAGSLERGCSRDTVALQIGIYRQDSKSGYQAMASTFLSRNLGNLERFFFADPRKPRAKFFSVSPLPSIYPLSKYWCFWSPPRCTGLAWSLWYS